MSGARPDAIVVGAGIVGAACAWELAREGLSVTVLESAPGTGGGATAAGMGHIIVLDDNGPELELTRYSQRLWHEVTPELPDDVQTDPCGCIWVAADDEEMQVVRHKHASYGSHGVPAEVLDAGALREAEPELRHGLAGGLLVPEDIVLYPPAFVRWLLQRGEPLGLRVETGVEVAAVDGGGVDLAGGGRREAGLVVNAAGNRALELMPRTWRGPVLRPRKGHLAITARVPGFCRRQLAELGYFKSAHGNAESSVAFNVQPRRTGQLLIGSSRQYGATDTTVEPEILGRMLRRAFEYLPRLARLPVVRTWTGFRPAIADKLPLIGAVPGHAGLYLAAGHEGLGITTSLGTGRLIADLVAGRPPALDLAPFAVDRSIEVGT